MSQQEAIPQSLPPSSEAEVIPGHWNDQFLVNSTNPTFREGVDATDLQGPAEEHLVSVWEQEQALLELAVAKIEGREAGITTEDTKKYGITDKVTHKSSSLVNELYLRMGAANDMERSDLLLTGLAGLVVDEVASESVPGFGEDYVPTDNPLDRSFAVINAFASRLGEQPELVDGKEREMLLAAELLSEALRTPNSVRGKQGNVAGEDGESFYTDFYAQSVVQICDAVTTRLRAKESRAPEGLSKKKLAQRDREQGIVQSAILTKYDTLFDVLEANPTSSMDTASQQLLQAFIAEATPVMERRSPGYGYELFAPILFRFVAMKGNVLDTSRVWHATARADTPKDSLGYSANRDSDSGGDPVQVFQHLKKQSSDASTGSKNAEDDTSSPFGRVSKRLQLKARDDGAEMAKEYDEKQVEVLSQDMANLLAYLDTTLDQADPMYRDFPMAEVFSESPREEVRAAALSQVMLGLVTEVSRRLSGSESEANHEFSVQGPSAEIKVDIPELLDQMVLPVYRDLVENVAGRALAKDGELVGV